MYARRIPTSVESSMSCELQVRVGGRECECTDECDFEWEWECRDEWVKIGFNRVAGASCAMSIHPIQ